jgi:hypothetical protein
MLGTAAPSRTPVTDLRSACHLQAWVPGRIAHGH